MDRSKFKTFIKFKKVENSYEDDCKIYYPTPWDREYIAYHLYCQDRMNRMALTASHTNIVYEEELQQYFENFHLYAIRSFFCRHEQNDEISPEFYEPSTFVPFDSSDVIKIYDNTSGDLETEQCDCSDSQYEGFDIDVVENDSSMRFNLNRVDYGTANYLEFDEYQSYCKHCQRRRRCRKQPSILNLGVFLSNLESKPKVLKRRKVKQFHSRKFEHVNRNSCSTSITSIVNSDINIEEIITVEDCDCNEIPTEDTRTFKMTYSKAIHCKSSKFRLIAKTTSGEVNNQTDTKDTKHRMQYSKIVSGDFSRFTLTPSTSKHAAEFNQVPTKGVDRKKSTTSTSNAEMDFKRIQMDQVGARKNIKTYSQALYRNLPKSKFINPTYDMTQNDNTDKISRGKIKTYSQVLYCNLSNSKIVKEKKSKTKVNLCTTQIDSAFDQTTTKDVKSCRTYSEVLHGKLPKPELRKPRSSNKKGGLRKADIGNAFGQVATEEVKSYKTSYSEAVRHNLSKSSSSNERSKEQRSTTDVNTCSTYSKVIYCTVSKSRLIKKPSSNNAFDQPPSHDVKTSETFSQVVSCGVPKLGNDFDQKPVKTIKETIHKKIKSKKTKPNKTKRNKIPMNDLSQTVNNILPETNLSGQKTSQEKIDSNIPNSQLWSNIVKGVPEKTMTYQIDSNTDNKSQKNNTVTFSKDTIEMEINPDIPISPTFHIVSGEIQAIISSVHDRISTYELDTKEIPWSQIVTGEKIHAVSSVPDKVSESKCNQDIPEIDKIANVATCKTWSQMVTGEKTPAVSSVDDQVSELKCKQDTSEIEKPIMPIFQSLSKIDSGAILSTSLVGNKTSKKKFKKNSNVEIKPRETNEAKLKMKSQTWSQIVTGEKIPAASSGHDKVSESKCNQDTSEIEKMIMPTYPTWSNVDSGAMFGPSLICDKTLKFKKDSNVDIKPRKTNEAKLKMNKKPRFVKLDMWSSPSEKTVEKPAELKQTNQSLFSYADIMKTRKTDASCNKSASVQRDTLVTPQKCRSHIDSSSPPTPQPIAVSKPKKDQWILQKSKHQRFKKNKT